MAPDTAAVTVRGGAPDDAVALAEIHVASWREAYVEFFPPEVLGRLSVTERTPLWRDRLLIGHGPDYFVLVGEIAERAGASGFATGGGTRDEDRKGAGEVYALYVHPGAQRLGVGAALLAEALRRLTEASFASATLWVLERNMGARAFYERCGWQADGARRPYHYEGVTLAEVRYEHPTR